MSEQMDRLTPTEDLVMEVLAARHRLGESLWTFDSRVARALGSLAAKGYVTTMHGIVENTLRASLTDAGRSAYLSDTYAPNLVPREELERAQRRLRMNGQVRAVLLRANDEAEAERDALAAKVARVEALRGRWRSMPVWGPDEHGLMILDEVDRDGLLDELDAALATEPAEGADDA